MRKFVSWTGVLHLVASTTFLFPSIARFLGVTVPESSFWVWTVAVSVFYLGIALILCSRDLTSRASLVYWEGILRLVAFLLFAGFGFFSHFGDQSLAGPTSLDPIVSVPATSRAPEWPAASGACITQVRSA